MPCSRKLCSNRSDSASARAVGIVTMQNSDTAGSCSSACTPIAARTHHSDEWWAERRRDAAQGQSRPHACSSRICCWYCCSATTARGSSSATAPATPDPPAPPKFLRSELTPPTREATPWKRWRSSSSRSMKRSRKSGKVSSRSVWPVGAVSMMTRSKWRPYSSARASETTWRGAREVSVQVASASGNGGP
eukprot:6500295-Prymnesium_polylepis.1